MSGKTMAIEMLAGAYNVKVHIINVRFRGGNTFLTLYCVGGQSVPGYASSKAPGTNYQRTRATSMGYEGR